MRGKSREEDVREEVAREEDEEGAASVHGCTKSKQSTT
jgi:hypothetical protein